MTNSMNIPEIETLSYHSPLCKCQECGKKPASAPQEGKEKTTPDIEPKTKIENKESVRQPQQPDYSKCRHCGACRIVRSAGEWQFACKCNEDDKIYPSEQPKDNQWELEYGTSEQLKDNPGPLEKLIMDRIEHDLENIAANLEMLNPETKEQNRAKCVLSLEIARITGKGGMFDDLKEAFE